MRKSQVSESSQLQSLPATFPPTITCISQAPAQTPVPTVHLTLEAFAAPPGC